jgi:hypothetical protein
MLCYVMLSISRVFASVSKTNLPSSCRKIPISLSFVRDALEPKIRKWFVFQGIHFSLWIMLDTTRICSFCGQEIVWSFSISSHFFSGVYYQRAIVVTSQKLLFSRQEYVQECTKNVHCLWHKRDWKWSVQTLVFRASFELSARDCGS